MKSYLLNVFTLLSCLWLAGCQSTNRPDEVKLTQAQIATLVKLTKNLEHYEKGIEQYRQDSSSIAYTELFNRYHQSIRIKALDSDLNELYNIIEQIETGQIRCQDADWKELQGKLFISFKVHTQARDCYQSIGDTEQADYYAQSLNYVIQGMFAMSDGKTQQTAHQVLYGGAADELVEMSGLSVIDYFTELGPNGKGLFYVYVIEKPNGQQSHMYFDFTRYFHSFLDISFPFAWLGNGMIDKVIMPLSEHNFLYLYSGAQAKEAEGLYDEAAQLYLAAIAQNGMVAYYKLGMLCYQQTLTTISQSECADYLVQAAQFEYVPALIALAVIYKQGIGVAADEQIYAKLMEKAEPKLPQGEAWVQYATISQAISQAQSSDSTDYDGFLQKGVEQGSVYAQILLLDALLEGKTEQQQLASPTATKIKQAVASIMPIIAAQSAREIAFFSVLVNVKITPQLITSAQYDALDKVIPIAANKGEPDANLLLGMLYNNESLGQYDVAKAIKHLRLAAQKLSVDAHLMLAQILIARGNVSDESEAELWLQLCKQIEPECAID